MPSKLISNPVGCDRHMNKVQEAFLSGETKVKPVVDAFSNLTKALEDYLKERRIIQNGYSIKDFGIVDPYPTEPTPAQAPQNRGCRVDPLTIPSKDDEEKQSPSPVADYISDFDMKMAKYCLYIQRLNSYFQEISNHYGICLELDEMYWADQKNEYKDFDCAVQFDKDYRIVDKAYDNIRYHFKYASLIKLMERMLDAVDDEVDALKGDRSSTTANLMRGLAMCMTIANEHIKNTNKEFFSCLSIWLMHGRDLICDWHNRDIRRIPAPPEGGRIISYAEDQAALKSYKPEVSHAVGGDLMR